MTISPQTKLAHLRVFVADTKGDVGAAVVRLAGLASSAALAEEVGLPRQTVQQALRALAARGDRRQYAHVYRALEAGLGIPQFSLDTIAA